MIEAVAVKALFPHEPTRRAFLKSVGKGTALAAIASVLPLASLQEAAAIDVLKPEKKSVDIGFLPILCSTPLIMADPYVIMKNKASRLICISEQAGRSCGIR